MATIHTRSGPGACRVLLCVLQIVERAVVFSHKGIVWMHRYDERDCPGYLSGQSGQFPGQDRNPVATPRASILLDQLCRNSVDFNGVLYRQCRRVPDVCSLNISTYGTITSRSLTGSDGSRANGHWVIVQEHYQSMAMAKSVKDAGCSYFPLMRWFYRKLLKCLSL